MFWFFWSVSQIPKIEEVKWLIIVQISKMFPRFLSPFLTSFFPSWSRKGQKPEPELTTREKEEKKKTQRGWRMRERRRKREEGKGSSDHWPHLTNQFSGQQIKIFMIEVSFVCIGERREKDREERRREIEKGIIPEGRDHRIQNFVYPFLSPLLLSILSSLSLSFPRSLSLPIFIFWSCSEKEKQRRRDKKQEE